MIRVVTGFVPIKNHPRPVEEYERLGDRLMAMGPQLEQKLVVCYGNLADCWLPNYLLARGKPALFSTSDNPAKNSISYHCVNHQKTEWLYSVACNDDKSDVFVWIDYGIFSVPGVTEDVIFQMLERAKHEQAISIPGCLDLPGDRGDDHPNWRFCGGLIVCPRRYVFELDTLLKAEAIRHLNKTNTLTWEVNTLARLELRNELPIWWYKADHNETMFTNYPETQHAS